MLQKASRISWRDDPTEARCLAFVQACRCSLWITMVTGITIFIAKLCDHCHVTTLLSDGSPRCRHNPGPCRLPEDFTQDFQARRPARWELWVGVMGRHSGTWVGGQVLQYMRVHWSASRCASEQKSGRNRSDLQKASREDQKQLHNCNCHNWKPIARHPKNNRMPVGML